MRIEQVVFYVIPNLYIHIATQDWRGLYSWNSFAVASAVVLRVDILGTLLVPAHLGYICIVISLHFCIHSKCVILKISDVISTAPGVVTQEGTS